LSGDGGAFYSLRNLNFTSIYDDEAITLQILETLETNNYSVKISIEGLVEEIF
jgi:hypothetical protein